MSFSINTIEHEFATVAHDLKVGAKAVAAFVTAHQGQIKTDIEVTTGVLATIPGLGPTAAVLERAGEASLGLLLNAIAQVQSDSKEGDAVVISVKVAKDLLSDFRQLLPALQGQTAKA